MKQLRRVAKVHSSKPAADSFGLSPGEDVARSVKLSPTERRHRGSMQLDRLPVSQAIRLMLLEEAGIARKLLKKTTQLERAISAIVRAFRQGGRLFYAGAGTSGRLGVLDASECPPTFCTPPQMVQGIIAGGKTALVRSVEGAEDDFAAGGRAINSHRITSKDVVVGIAASGTTPFVWGALREARRRSACTVLLCFNPFVQIPPALRPKILIAPNLGPEVLTGSTRLKAGTATKLVLNLFSTIAMVRLGKVKSNLMIDLRPTNVKLKRRAVRIVQLLTGKNEVSARAALEHVGWVVKKAMAQLSTRR